MTHRMSNEQEQAWIFRSLQTCFAKFTSCFACDLSPFVENSISSESPLPRRRLPFYTTSLQLIGVSAEAVKAVAGQSLSVSA